MNIYIAVCGLLYKSSITRSLYSSMALLCLYSWGARGHSHTFNYQTFKSETILYHYKHYIISPVLSTHFILIGGVGKREAY